MTSKTDLLKQDNNGTNINIVLPNDTYESISKLINEGLYSDISSFILDAVDWKLGTEEEITLEIFLKINK